MNTIIPLAISNLHDMANDIADACRKLTPAELADLVHQAGELETSAKGSAILAVKLVKEVAKCVKNEEKYDRN